MRVRSRSPHHPTMDSSRPRDEKIDIFLKVQKTVSLKVKRSESIRNVKAMLCEKEGITKSHLQEVSLYGRPLMDGQTLAECGIRQASVLRLILGDSDKVKLYIKVPSLPPAAEKTYVVQVKISDTVRHIKSLIQAEAEAKEEIEADQCTLMHAGILLDDFSTLNSLNILGDNTLFLVRDPRAVLPIYVKSPYEERIELQVKLPFTVHEVKTIAGSMMDFPIKDHIVFYNGKQLEEHMSLAHYKIKRCSVLKIFPPIPIRILPAPPIPIFVMMGTGLSVTIDVLPSDTVGMVLERVSRLLKLPPGQHWRFCSAGLHFDGKLLKEERDLASYNIQKDAVLHVGPVFDYRKSVFK